MSSSYRLYSETFSIYSQAPIQRGPIKTTKGTKASNIIFVGPLQSRFGSHVISFSFERNKHKHKRIEKPSMVLMKLKRNKKKSFRVTFNMQCVITQCGGNRTVLARIKSCPLPIKYLFPQLEMGQHENACNKLKI